MRYWRKFRNTRGAVLVFVAILLVVLIGMAALAIDVGRMYIARQRAQNVCDASALAGGAYLDGTLDCTGPGDLPAVTAEQCAAGNNELTAPWQVLAPGTTDPGVEVTFPSGAVTDDAGRAISVDDGEAITVRGQVDVDFTFARIFGLSGTEVGAGATAIIDTVTKLCSPLFVPLAVSDLTIFGDGVEPGMTFGELVTLHVSDHTEGFLGPGNYLSLRFEGDSGANDYRNRLRGDEGEECLSVGEVVSADTEPGYMGQPTYDGLTDRLTKETNPDYAIDNPNAWQNWEASKDPDTGMYDETWRIVILPVIEDTMQTVSGMEAVEVVGMAGFFIDKVYYGTEDDEHRRQVVVEGYFIQGIAIGDTVRWTFPTPGTEPEGPQLIQELRLIS